MRALLLVAITCLTIVGIGSGSSESATRNPRTRTDMTVATAQRNMNSYCTPLHMHGVAWTEIDSDGNASIYGRCV